MLPHILRPQQLRGYLQRNFEQMSSGMGTEDAWRSYLQKATGLAQDGIEGLESHRLSMLGFTGPTLSDQWHKFLASEGYGGKSLGDGLRAYFTAGDDGGGDDQTFDGGASVTGQPYGLLLALTQP